MPARQKAIEYTSKGLELFAKDSFDQAIKYFSQAILADNTYEEAYFRRANTEFLQHDTIKAAKDYQWLEKHDSKRAEVYEKLGDIALPMLDEAYISSVNQAFLYYSKAIKLDSTQGSYYAKRGQVLFNNMDYEQAATDFQKAIGLNYTSAEIYSELAYSLSRLDDNKHAVLYYNKAIALDPKNMADYANRGYSLMAIHQLNDALDDLTFYLKYDSTDVYALYNLGHTQYGLNQYDAAIATMKKVLKLYPNFQDTWFRLGLTYADKADYKSAIDAFDHAIAFKPEAYLYYNRAIAKAKNDPKSDYCSDLKRASSLGYPDADKMLEKVCKH